MDATGERALIISSDGHAMPRMRDYRPYLTSRLQESFDEFCDFYEEFGRPPMDPAHLRGRLDPDVVDQWERDLWDTGRLDGCSDPVKRLQSGAEVDHPIHGNQVLVGLPVIIVEMNVNQPLPG